ncbi:MAG: type 4a pilus biogenesis protein PilO [bacterium]
MDIGQKKDIIAFALIVILAFSIGYNRIYRRNLNKINSIKLQFEREKKKNDILGITNILDRKSQVHQKRSFSTADTTQLLDRVSQAAEEAGIKIEGFNPLSAVPTEQYLELPLKISLRCEYHKLGRFLSLIESSKEFIWVKELKMQKATATDPRAPKIPRINLTVSGFYLEK